MMPSCDQIGVPIHFHSSTTSGPAALMSLRILARVSPRQSPSSAILSEMSSDAGGPSLAPVFFMFSPRSIRTTQRASEWKQRPHLPAVLGVRAAKGGDKHLVLHFDSLNIGRSR